MFVSAVSRLLGEFSLNFVIDLTLTLRKIQS